MSGWKRRTVFSRMDQSESDGRRRRGLLRERAGGVAAEGGSGGLEMLEPRVLLAGDHPSFSDFPDSTEILLNGDGEGFATGELEVVNDDDLFRFTAPETDFVSIKADGTNPARRAGDPTPLDTRLRIFNSAGEQIGVSSGDGVLTGGTPTDAWFGFIAQAGETYYVNVLSDSDTVDRGTGDYVLRIDAISSETQVDTDVRPGVIIPVGEVIPPDPLMPPPLIQSDIGADDPATAAPDDEFSGDDEIFRIDVPQGEEFDSLATIGAAPFANQPANLDTRIEVFDSAGNRIASNSQAGFLTAAFTTFRSRPGETFYVRVRSDEIGDPDVVPSAGRFTLRGDVSALEVPLNPVTRRGELRAGDPDHPPILFDPNWSQVYRFQAASSGAAFIGGFPAGAPHDVAVSVYNEAGQQIAFADDTSGGIGGEVREFPLEGGKDYFVVLTGFDDAPSGLMDLLITANYTYNQSDDELVDDHPNEPGRDATPLVFDDPFIWTDAHGNRWRDRSWIQRSTSYGRIWGPDESDFFQFIPPVDMLGAYAGNNDDAGTSLFVGGAFTIAEENEPVPVDSPALAIWDAGDWWHVGRQPTLRWPVGMFDNPDTPESDGPQVHALHATTLPAGYIPGTGNDHPVLIVGGDFELRYLDALGTPQSVRNLAIWTFQPFANDVINPGSGPDARYDWFPLLAPQGANGVVRAIETFDPESFDPDGDGPAEEIDDPGGPWLMVGGEFSSLNGTAANGLGYFDPDAGSWIGLTDLGAGAKVHALTLFDPPDPGAGRDPDVLPGVQDPPDPPLSLFIGGEFSTSLLNSRLDGPFPVQNIAAFNGEALVPALYGQTATGELATSVVDGPVYALTVYDPPERQTPLGPIDPDPYLVVGGEFTNAGGTAASNLAGFGIIGGIQDPDDPDYSPQLIWKPLGSGTNGPVYAVEPWDQPTPGEDIDPVLVVGGDFTAGASPNITTWNDVEFTPLTGGFDEPVRALRAYTDQQEPFLQEVPGFAEPNSREVLYAGGDFANIIVGGFPTPAGRMAFYDITPFGFAWTPTREGADDSVFALEVFDDHNPDVDNSDSFWDRHDRASERLRMVVSSRPDSLINFIVRVYDSNFALIYENDTIFPPFPDPPGSNDQSLTPGLDFIGPPIWGGETYYIEVTTAGNTGGAGSYLLDVFVDSAPQDEDGDGVSKNINGTDVEIPDPDDDIFNTALARNMQLDPDGDARNYNGTASNPYPADEGRVFKYVPSAGPLTSRISLSDLGQISSIDDTDVYVFTAARSGTTEVRLATKGITDEYAELLGGPVVTRTKTYDSPLDGALRVLNNDFEQITYNNDNEVTRGDRAGGFVGSFADRTFTGTDPRVVFDVVEGERYFIIVESGQRWVDGSIANIDDRVDIEPHEIDWRTAIGSYELLVNAPLAQNLPPADDHANTPGSVQATVIGVDQDGNAVVEPFVHNAGTPDDPSDDFRFAGRIHNNTDTDVFLYRAPREGTAEFIVDRAQLSPTLTPRVTIFDQAGQAIAQGQATGGSPARVTFPTTMGEYYHVMVDALAGSTGEYTMALNGPAPTDDHGDAHQWARAERIRLFDFLGRGEISGTIERPGDSDIFRFSPFDFQDITIRAEGIGAFNPVLEVWEITEDQNGFPMQVLIARSDDTDTNGDGQTDSLHSRVDISVRNDRTSPISGETYDDFFIVVRAADPIFGIGDYRVSLEFDPTDDHADVEELLDPDLRDLATDIVINPTTGQGGDSGVIERPSDSDVFTFLAPAGGQTGLNVTRQLGSTLDARITVYNANAEVITSTEGDLPDSVSFEVVRGTRYFVSIEPLDSAPAGDQVGGYNVSITAPAVDDHPNAGEWDLATILHLQSATGDAQVGTGQLGGNNPTIAPPHDTDLFTFTTIGDGNVLVSVIPLGGGVTLKPRLTVFDSDREVVDQASTVANGQTVSVTIPEARRNRQFFILVEDSLGAAPPNAEYTLLVDGPPGEAIPPDPSFIDFANPRVVTLDRRGDAQANDEIEVVDDRDLFAFTAPSDGRAFVQIVAPSGSLLNASVTVLDRPMEDPDAQVAFDDTGFPGTTANVSFDVVGGTIYYLIVDGIGASTGSYQVRIDAPGSPVQTGIDEVDQHGFTHHLFYPEGFSSRRIEEFVSIANPNDFDIRYSVILRYEVGERDAVVVNNAFLGAGSRGGVTLNDGRRGIQHPAVRRGEPYSIEVVASGPIGATLSHYDFDISTGESFTEVLSDDWQFARVERVPGVVNDFIVFYNPNPFDVSVTLTAWNDNGNAVNISKVVGAFRRGGWNINAENDLPTGLFGAVVSAEAADASNEGEFLGIVAAMSHFDVGDSAGYGVIGDASGGSRAGVVNSLVSSAGVEPELVIFNPRPNSARVDITGTYIRANLPDLERSFQVPGRGVLRLTASDLGMADNQPVGISYSANRRVSVVASEQQNGDANGVAATSEMGSAWFFGDAFIGRNRAGTTYFETLSFHNPMPFAANIEVEIFFVNGASHTFNVSVDAEGFAQRVLHERQALLNDPNYTNAFSIEVRAETPFSATLTHYDLLLGGGWSSNGANIGLLNSLIDIRNG